MSCKRRLQWDDDLAADQQRALKNWFKNVNTLVTYNIPRCLKLPLVVSTIDLHNFFDGSEKAYGAVRYFKFLYEDKTVSTALISSKSRLTPLNNLNCYPKLNTNEIRSPIGQTAQLCCGTSKVKRTGFIDSCQTKYPS